jgi:ABC-type dipeptide/oligopeptide/nickel transport system ATPase component
VTGPRLVFMDEPTGGLDVSVQARLLDLLARAGQRSRAAVIVVTHDLAVARLLSHRMMVMKDGQVVETGLTDRVLDDPRAPYTQLLVSSVLQVRTMIDVEIWGNPSRCTTRAAWLSRFWKVRASPWRPANAWR